MAGVLGWRVDVGRVSIAGTIVTNVGKISIASVLWRMSVVGRVSVAGVLEGFILLANDASARDKT